MAPMAGITNMAFRKIVKEFGAGLVYSEMVSDKAICYGNQKTIEMLQVDEGEHPVSIQLFGGEVESMVEAAKFIDQHSNCDIIDINCGCPVNKVLKANAGSKLLQNPQLIYLHGNAHDTLYNPLTDRRNRQDVRMPPMSAGSSRSHSLRRRYMDSPLQISATMLFLRYFLTLHQDFRNPMYLQDLRRFQIPDIQNLLLLLPAQFCPSSFPLCNPHILLCIF